MYLWAFAARSDEQITRSMRPQGLLGEDLSCARREAVEQATAYVSSALCCGNSAVICVLRALSARNTQISACLQYTDIHKDVMDAYKKYARSRRRLRIRFQTVLRAFASSSTAHLCNAAHDPSPHSLRGSRARSRSAAVSRYQHSGCANPVRRWDVRFHRRVRLSPILVEWRNAHDNDAFLVGLMSAPSGLRSTPTVCRVPEIP